MPHLTGTPIFPSCLSLTFPLILLEHTPPLLFHQASSGTKMAAWFSAVLAHLTPVVWLLQAWNRTQILNLEVTSYPRTHDFLGTSLSPAGHSLLCLRMSEMNTNLARLCENHRRDQAHVGVLHQTFSKDSSTGRLHNTASGACLTCHRFRSNMCTLFYLKLIHSRSIYQVPIPSHLLK